MAVLGVGGRLRLKREAPEATVLRPDSVNVSSNSLYLKNPAFWSGDQVTITCANGLPIDSTGGGPDCPDGHGVYAGSDWSLGSNRSHILDNTYAFYGGNNSAPFYMREEECGLTTRATYYIYRDQLDRVSFYTSKTAALNGKAANRIPLYRVDFNALVIAMTGLVEYQNAIADCAGDIGDYRFSDAQDEVTLSSICDAAPSFQQPVASQGEYDNADLYPRAFVDGGEDATMWMVQADLREWTLNLNAPEVDTTAVGERFGDSVKSVVSGGGTMDFLVDRRTGDGLEQDTTALLQLLLLTEKGCKAVGEFWMISRSPSPRGGLLPGDLYYTTELLVTSVAINTRADDVIAGSLNFVTVGEIGLRMGTN